MGSRKGEPPEIYPKFIAKQSKDLMIRGGDFYAVWDESKGCWSTSQDDVVNMIDNEMEKYKAANSDNLSGAHIAYMWDADSGSIDKWRKYVTRQVADNYHPLDEKLVFANSEPKREDYSSKHLDYTLEDGPHDAWDELIGTLYSPTERHKIEWMIGAVVSGESKTLQKFLVFYGDSGTGKSTILNVIQKLFDGYYGMFDAKALGSANAEFALEAFKTNPLVAIQHDGDLSRIEDNTRLNSLVSHEEIPINEKFKSQYSMRIHSMLFMGTNRPVKITDSKSGVIRRLIDVSPTGNKIPNRRYNQLVKNVNFELGAIAKHCLDVFEEDPHYYDDYVPKSMVGATNDFFNFMEEYFEEFKKTDFVTLNDAWFKYRIYCDDAKVPYPYSKRIFKEELKNYFKTFRERGAINGEQHRNLYSGLKLEKFGIVEETEEKTDEQGWLQFNTTDSILDKIGSEWPAQYAHINEDGSDRPSVAWSKCETILKDLNTAELHYLRCPEQFAFIDFDKKDPKTGEKSLELNMKAAEKWPPTYAELSKSGQGIHLTYIYTGDISKVLPEYEDDVEIKFYTGKASLRRKLTRCNDLPIATITSGLPLRKENKKTVNEYTIEDQKHLVAAIRKALRKEVEPFATTTCVDYIGKVLQDAYDSGMKYDVSEMKPQILAFAASSTHNAIKCLDKAESFPYKSEETSDWVPPSSEDKVIAFFDTEVFPNLFILCYKPIGKDVVSMINPEPGEVLKVFQTYNMIGFNNLGYDNHICYARIRGDSIYELFLRSQNLINAPKGRNDWAIQESKNLSYTDIFDFCSEKKGLKFTDADPHTLLENALDGFRKEMDENGWEYGPDDEELFELAMHPEQYRPFKSGQAKKQLLADIQKAKDALFVYPDLAKEFPGYEYNPYGIDRDRYISKDVIISGKSIYKGYDPGEGGFVYAVPGMYGYSECYDSASHHPSSLIAENGFGPYTENFKMLLDIRLHIKHKDYDWVRSLYDGILAPYLTSDEDAKQLSQALKIAINSVYGLTAAHFPNKLNDPRNIDNWVAKRGALFMIDLMLEVQKKGYHVIHVKTDSIKIEKPDQKIFDFVYEFGKKYGYTFEIEHKFDRICLVNDAVYICKYTDDPANGKQAGKWDGTGDQFNVKSSPYVFKSLFSKEPIDFYDMTETQTVKVGLGLYLDMDENLPDSTLLEKEESKLLTKWKKVGFELNGQNDSNLASGFAPDLTDVSDRRLEQFAKEAYHADYLRLCEVQEDIRKCHDYHFIGKAGLFCPMKEGAGGGRLVRENNGRFAYAAGAKGYRWLEAETVKRYHLEDQIDISYFESQKNDAIEAISKFGDFNSFAQ